MANKKDPDLLDEYDFSQGVRGKYAQRYRSRYSIALPSQVICLNTISGVDKSAQ